MEQSIRTAAILRGWLRAIIILAASVETVVFTVLSATATSTYSTVWTTILGPRLIIFSCSVPPAFVGFDFAGSSGDGETDCWEVVIGHCPRLAWQDDEGPSAPACPLSFQATEPREDPWLIGSREGFDAFVNDSHYWDGFVCLQIDVDFDGEEYTTAVIAPDVSKIGDHQGGIIHGHF